ncbi:MAG TPA: histidine kinase dimerization/phospho-acceptor domain-containing protein [Sphingomicrobium sp.]
MRFDDRLLTVLNQPAGDRRDVAVRWRQLVDLVARAGNNASSPTVAQALDSIRSDASNVDERLRAAAARAVAALPLPLGLLEYFASDRLTVSAPVLAAATLEPPQWQAILAAVDAETRRFIETLHPEIRAESPAEFTDTLVESPTEERPAPASSPSLHDVVERIERRRRMRSTMRRARNLDAVPQGSPSLFRWECGPGGEIAWVDGAPRGALIGRSISRVQNGEGDKVDPEVLRAFVVRAPFRDAALNVAGDGLMSGQWKISGVPAFDPSDGRFRGYRGIALREQEEGRAADEAVEALADPDSLRELVHEIKTPLNAIIGFAEIIEGQYLGPADRRYRERAQEIVRQARLLLTAIDDLDFAAKVHSSAGGAHARVNLGELVERLMPALRELAAARGVEVDGPRTSREATAATEPELADRLIFRMCSALIEQAESGERLRLGVDRAGERWRVSMARPVKLVTLSEEELVGGEADFEQSFSLRLVRGLARIAGADLVAPKGTISLLFPRI